MRTIEYKGHRFQVVDELYNNWDFWGSFAKGAWEHHVLERIAEVGDGLFFDVGAWVGPMSMWAASHGSRVIAIEPDPVAFAVLEKNVVASGLESLITMVQVAVMPTSGTVTLNTQNGGGDSQSSVARTNMPDSIQVEAKTLQDLVELYGAPDLIKMDIEGGEGFVIPAAGPYLRSLGIPLLLSLHLHWLPEGTREAFDEELNHWQSKKVENDTNLYFTEEP